MKVADRHRIPLTTPAIYQAMQVVLPLREERRRLLCIVNEELVGDDFRIHSTIDVEQAFECRDNHLASKNR